MRKAVVELSILTLLAVLVLPMAACAPREETEVQVEAEETWEEEAAQTGGEVESPMAEEPMEEGMEAMGEEMEEGMEEMGGEMEEGMGMEEEPPTEGEPPAEGGAS